MLLLGPAGLWSMAGWGGVTWPWEGGPGACGLRQGCRWWWWGGSTALSPFPPVLGHGVSGGAMASPVGHPLSGSPCAWCLGSATVLWLPRLSPALGP